MTAPTGILLMAYGTPERLEDVGESFTHIRGGRRPTDEAVAHLAGRYARVGGGTPLRKITEAVRDGLQTELTKLDGSYRVYVGMKHWHPFIAEAMAQMQRDGVRNVIAVALAPHYSRMSVGAYKQAFDEANAALGSPFTLQLVETWHLEPAFIGMMADRVKAALRRVQRVGHTAPLVVFTAHSLPIRIREWNDPYETQLLASSKAVADRVGLTDWRFAWQSAGGTTEPWIGPDILDYLEVLHGEGVRQVVQVPIGFVSDHLEVLYDIDIEAVDAAKRLGMQLVRTELPNATPEFVRTLRDVVRGAGVR
jgi:protoporphyrin/coproporphyrin ferrochelatase